MKHSRILALLLVMALAATVLAGCGGADSYKDGTYTGKSTVFEGDEGEGDGYGVVTLTIEGGAITACDFKTYEPDGTLKDEDYGKQNGEIANQDYYNKAQKALAGANEYAKILVEVGDYHAIDSISGATISYNQFMEAVDDALYQAKE
ncbi:MAG: FMN-binding protein [Firmicutes bacterium]|nr:FMN-binding protein [Bacillota bacterium]